MSILASDNFTRANENPLNSTNWSIPPTFIALKVLSNECQASSASGTAGEIWTGPSPASWPNDQFSQIQIHVDGDTFSNYQVLCRANTSNSNFYAFIIPGPLGNTITNCLLAKNVAGVFTVLATFTTTPNPDSLIRLEVQGTTLRAYVDGILKQTVTDSDITAGNPGLVANCNGRSATDIQISAWVGGDFSTPGSSTQAGAFLVGL